MKKNYQIALEKKGQVISLLKPTLFLSAFLFFVTLGFLRAASNPEHEDMSAVAPQADCNVFYESNGLVVIQAESKTSSGWAKKSENGAGYIQWTGSETFNSATNGKITYKVNFKTPGIYRFVWKNTIKHGSNTTEHNDSWLKFPNNSNITFFGHQGDARNVGADLQAKKNVVFPGGTGLSPTPNGTSVNGYFKVYLNSTSWQWIANTGDHDPHKIYIHVKQAGTYDMQIAARSFGHAIDGMVMYHLDKQGASLPNSKLNSVLNSVKDCSDIPNDPDPEPDPTPSNSEPNISDISNKSVEEGETLTVKISASDPDQDAINLSVTIKKGSNNYSSNNYNFTSKNGGKEGELVVTPKDGDAGKLDVSVKASDGKATDEETFSIQVAEADAPAPDPDPEPEPDPGNAEITVYLVDANTNKDIKALGNNSSFDIGNVSLRAEIKGVNVPGVTFTLKGGPDNINHVKREGAQPPYGVFGDIGVKMVPWKDIKAGKYTLDINVTSNVSKTISFTVNGGSNPDPTPDPTPGNDGITVYLVDANTNKDIKALGNNSSFGLGKVGLRAEINGIKVPGVTFRLKGGPDNINHEQVEGSQPPYGVFGDIGVDIVPWKNIKTGKYTLETVVWGQASQTISFTVTGGSNPDPTPDPEPTPGGEEVTIYLVNASNNNDIKVLGNNSSFAVGNVGLRAEVKGVDVPGVTFRLKGGPDNISHEQIEGSQPPYGVFGDIGVKIEPWKNIKAGKYTLETVVWGQASKTINFTVTGNNARVGEQAVAKGNAAGAEALEDQLYSNFKVARLYPNPVAEELTLEYTGESDQEDIALTLVSRLGQSFPIAGEALHMDGSTIKVNMSGLNISAGVYILKVVSQSTGTTEVYRLIKY